MCFETLNFLFFELMFAVLFVYSILFTYKKFDVLQESYKNSKVLNLLFNCFPIY